MSADDLFRERVRAVMKERGLSQRKIGRDLGMGPTWANMWMKGKRSVPLDRAEAVAAYLEIDLGALLTRSDQPGHTVGVQRGLVTASHVSPDRSVSDREELAALRQTIRRVADALSKLAEGSDVGTSYPSAKTPSEARRRRRRARG